MQMQMQMQMLMRLISVIRLPCCVDGAPESGAAKWFALMRCILELEGT